MPEDEELDKDTVDQVLRLVSKRCRQEVEAALDERTELSIACKQDIQSVLSGGYDAFDAVPVLPQDVGVLKHQTAISLCALTVALFGVAFRVFLRHRRAPAEAKAAAMTKKAGKKKAAKQVKTAKLK